MTKLLDLYTSILNYHQVSVNEKGECEYSLIPSEKKPVIFDEKRLVLPTPENLRNSDGDTRLIFHPLREMIDRGESLVVKGLRHLANIRLNYATMGLINELLRIANSEKLHSGLSPEQRKVLIDIGEVDLRTRKNFTDFCVKQYEKRNDRLFCHVFMRKRGTYQGQKHARVGIVTFPLYDILKEKEVLGLEREKDRKTFLNALRAVFPGSDEDGEKYNGYSDSVEAPWLLCLLNTSYNLAFRLNELFDLFSEHIEGVEELKFNDDWVNEVQDLSTYKTEIRMIPSQRGNEGPVEGGEEPKEPHHARPVPQNQRPVQASSSQTQAEPPLPVPTPVQPQAAIQQTYQPPPTPQPVYQPQQPVYQQPGYPQPPQPVYQSPAAPSYAERTSSGKLDFRAIAARNPQVAAAAQIPTPLTAWQQAQTMPPGYGPAPGMGMAMNRPLPHGTMLQPGYGPAAYPQPGYHQPGYGPAPGVIYPV